jgi:predicted metal-dependent phosphoesterase TrpH
VDSAVQHFDNEYGVTVIPSIEVTAETGEHLLYYFETKDALRKFHSMEIKGREKERSVNDLLKLRDKYKCLVSWAHPAGWNFFNRKKKITFDLRKIDCLEIINGHAALWNVKQTAKWAQRHNNSYTGGSDVHEISQLGRVVTCAKAKTIAEFLDKVKKRDVKIIGQRVDMFKFMMRYPFKIAIAKLNYLIRF